MSAWRTLELVLLLGIPIALMLYGATTPRREPAEPPRRPQDASSDAGWLLLPFQLVAGLAGLCWAAIGLLVFLSPLLILAAVALAVLR